MTNGGEKGRDLRHRIRRRNASREQGGRVEWSRGGADPRNLRGHHVEGELVISHVHQCGKRESLNRKGGGEATEKEASKETRRMRKDDHRHAR